MATAALHAEARSPRTATNESGWRHRQRESDCIISEPQSVSVSLFAVAGWLKLKCSRFRRQDGRAVNLRAWSPIRILRIWFPARILRIWSSTNSDIPNARVVRAATTTNTTWPLPLSSANSIRARPTPPAATCPVQVGGKASLANARLRVADPPADCLTTHWPRRANARLSMPKAVPRARLTLAATTLTAKLRATNCAMSYSE